MINFAKGKKITNPFYLNVIEDVFDQEVLMNLISEFPEVSSENIVMGGRRRLISQSNKDWIKQAPTWSSLIDFLGSQENLNRVISENESALIEWDSNLTKETVYEDECFFWLDWSISEDGYYREPHSDSNTRFWNFIIFLNDKDWEGGDFCIHSSTNISFYKKSFWLKKLPITHTFEAKRNRGIFFLSTPNSYHSVSLQHETRTPRKFVYGSISFKGDAFNRRYSIKRNIISEILERLDETPQLLRRIKRKLFR